MARIPATRFVPPIPQDYPRIRDESSKYYGYLDTDALQEHPSPRRISPELLKSLILKAIQEASVQSSREAILIPAGMSSEQEKTFFRSEAKKLFGYFHAYPVDPAATAHEYTGRHYRDVGLELFRNRAIQKGRMNSGWRYQLLARECAKASGRFDEAAGFGFSKGDFVAKISFRERVREKLHIYVSVKNRRSTIGGQDWPNSIQALGTAARSDNRQQDGPYICVFGIAIDRGQRAIPKSATTKKAYSENTEVWLSDFFWPFFSDYSYAEIMTAMLEALIEADASQQELPTQIQAPEQLLEAFGECCHAARLVDDNGVFSDPVMLVRFFCSPLICEAGKLTMSEMECQVIRHKGLTGTLVLADSREYLPGMPDQADLIVTSPPYADARHKHYDSVHPDDFAEWFLTFHQPFYDVLKPSGSLIINIKDKVVNGVRHRFVWHMIEKLCANGWYAIDDYIWHKTNPMPGYWPTRLRDGWEYCFHLARSPKPYFNANAVKRPIGRWADTRLRKLGKNDTSRHNSVNESGFGRDISSWVGKDMVLPSNVLSLALVGRNRNHPAVFPVDLPLFFIKLLSPPGGVVIDPFGGSGSTGVAAFQCGRNFIYIDNNPGYYRAAVNRITLEIQSGSVGSNQLYLLPDAED